MGHYLERLRIPPGTSESWGAQPRYEPCPRDCMVVECDLRTPTRAGFDIWIDLFRPADPAGPAPVLIAWTPYGKHDLAPLATLFPASGWRFAPYELRVGAIDPITRRRRIERDAAHGLPRHG